MIPYKQLSLANIFQITRKNLKMTDQLLLTFLAYSKPLREFCGFTNALDASKITLFKQGFWDDLQLVFNNLVDITESIC